MFSFNGTSSPARSDSRMSESSRWEGSSIATCSPSRDSNWNSTNGSPTSSVASFRTTSSTMSTGVKSRQIRDMKLEMELKDGRINELESAYEELERKAAFQAGETNCKLESYEHDMSAMNDEQSKLKDTIEDQNKKLDDVNKSLAEFQQMHSSFKMIMERCAELEEFQRKKQAEEEEAKKKAEEEKKAQEEAERLKIEEQEAEAKRLAEEEEAKASRLAEEEEARYVAEQESKKAEEEEQMRQMQQQGGRPLPMKQQQQQANNGNRPQSAPQNNNSFGRRNNNNRANGPNGKKDCAMM